MPRIGSYLDGLNPNIQFVFSDIMSPSSQHYIPFVCLFLPCVPNQVPNVGVNVSCRLIVSEIFLFSIVPYSDCDSFDGISTVKSP